MMKQCTFKAFIFAYVSTAHFSRHFILAGECEALARDWLDNVYEADMRTLLEGYVQKDWEYNTDITDENAAESVCIMKIVEKKIPYNQAICVFKERCVRDDGGVREAGLA